METVNFECPDPRVGFQVSRVAVMTCATVVNTQIYRTTETAFDQLHRRISQNFSAEFQDQLKAHFF